MTTHTVRQGTLTIILMGMTTATAIVPGWADIRMCRVLRRA